MVYLVKSARYVFKIADVVIQRTIPHLKKNPHGISDSMWRK